MNDNKTYFAEVAGDWDEIRTGFFTEEMRDAAIRLGSLNENSVVADIGTGTGFVIQGLADKVAKVYGFDPSAEMLSVAANNLARFDNVVLKQAPGHQLPLQDQEVDAVFGNMYLHHDPDPATAILELARILKPGGRLVLTDLDAHTEHWMLEEMADRWLGFDREQIKRWFEAAGLVDVFVADAAGSCESATPTGGAASLSIFAACGSKSA